MVGGCELLWDRRSGDSKANSRLGWVCLPWGGGGGVLDFCDKRSCETVPEMDVAAEVFLWGAMFFKRLSNSLWRDGGGLFSFCML